MRRIVIDIPDETFEAISARALDERRSLKDQAGWELERLFAPTLEGFTPPPKIEAALGIKRAAETMEEFGQWMYGAMLYIKQKAR